MSFSCSFGNHVPHSKRLESECRSVAQQLEAEFPETQRFEVSMRRAGPEYEAHVHVVGKDLSVSSSAHHRALREAAHEAFQRAQRQLRRRHDKLILGRRREDR